MALAAGTGLIATVIPSYFVNAGMARIGATSTALISNVSPLLTIYFAVILLGEDFTWADAYRFGFGGLYPTAGATVLFENVRSRNLTAIAEETP